MALFKKKIYQKDIPEIIYNIGIQNFLFLKEQFSNEPSINESILFIMTITTTSLFFERICMFRNIKLKFDISKKVNELAEKQLSESPIEIYTYYLTIRDELWELMYNDNFELFDLANYFVNEITLESNENEMLVNYISEILTDWHFYLKSIINNIKIV